MGAVYEALHESIERRVALKVLHPEYARNPDAVQRFFNEARAVNRIEHPNIVQVSEFGQADDCTVFLVMEFLRGETLSARLDALGASKRPMRPIEAVQIGAQLADALAAAHKKGIIHRDLKPGNVMLVPDALSPGGERVKLLDFGIAKLTQGGGKATETNALVGTPQYMSPEQCRGAGGVDDRTDVYALGVMLYEMLAGRPPFVAEEALGYLAQHAYQQPPPLASLAPNTPPEIPKLVHRLLAKDKSVRPAMTEVRSEFMHLLATLSDSFLATIAPAEPRAHSGKASSGAPSTLGGSQGQTLQSRPLRLKALPAVALLAFLGMVAGVGRLLLQTAPNSLPASVAQPAPTRAAPPAQTELPVQTKPTIQVELPVRAEATPTVQLSTGQPAPVVEEKNKPPQRPAAHSPFRPGSSPHTAKPATSPSSAAPPKASRKFVD